MKQYVITEDLKFLMEKWAKQNGFQTPGGEFFYQLQGKLTGYLSTIFPNLVLLGCNKLSQGMKDKIQVAQEDLVVSIDQIYNNPDFYLESNRIADLNTMKIIGEAQRPGYPSLSEQVSGLPNGRPIILVDDGCFSGDTLLRIYKLITSHGYSVCRIIVGIIIDRADNQFVREFSEVSLEAVYEFDKVIDWVCERDFFIGVPLSGRTAGINSNGIIIPCYPEISLPYCLPFGDPIKGASIPIDQAVEFSKFIIELSIELWNQIELASNKPVLSKDVPRLPKGVECGDKRFVDALLESIQQL